MAAQFIVNCSCGQPLQVQAQHAGQTVQCPNCNSLVQIPQQQAAAAPVAAPAATPARPAPQAQMQQQPLPASGVRPQSMADSGGGKAGWIIGGVLGGVALLIGIIVIVSGNPEEGRNGTGSGGQGGTAAGPGGEQTLDGLMEWPETFSRIEKGKLPATPTKAHETQGVLPIRIRGKMFAVPVIGDAPVAAVPTRMEIRSDKAFEFYDLKNGNHISTIPSNEGDGDLLDISPDGNRAAVSDDGIVRIYEVGSAKEIAEFSPPNLGKGIGREIKRGWFVGRNGFLLFDSGPNVVGLWDFDDEKYRWAHIVPGYGSNRVAIDPSRKYAFLNAEGKLPVLDAYTGEAIGELPAAPVLSDTRYHNFKEVRFSPDGKLMAATFGSVGTNVPLAVWNIPEATLLGEYEISKSLAAIFDERYILFGDYSSYWIRDLEEERDVWMLRVKCDPSAFTARGASPWYVSSYAGTDEGNYLASSKVDVADLLSRSKKPSEPPLLSTGGKVSVDISGDKPSRDSGFNSRIAEQISKGLRDKGFVVESGQPIRCKVSFTVKKSGESRKYYAGGSGSKSVDIPEKHIEVAVVISDSTGKAYWRNSRTAYQRSFIPSDAAREPQTYLDDEQWKSAEEIIGKIRIPGQVWTKPVMGSSAMNKDGFLH